MWIQLRIVLRIVSNSLLDVAYKVAFELLVLATVTCAPCISLSASSRNSRNPLQALVLRRVGPAVTSTRFRFCPRVVSLSATLA